MLDLIIGITGIVVLSSPAWVLVGWVVYEALLYRLSIRRSLGAGGTCESSWGLPTTHTTKPFTGYITDIQPPRDRERSSSGRTTLASSLPMSKEASGLSTPGTTATPSAPDHDQSQGQ